MKHLLLTLAFALFVTSCSDTTSPDPTPVSYKVPGTGSTFTYDAYDIDEQGTKKTGSEKELVESVTATNAVVDNSTGVWIVQGADTTYFHIDQYNDVQMRASGMNDAFFNSAWVRLPYSTGAPSSVFFNDRVNNNGVVYDIGKAITAERLGIKSYEINGTTINAYDFRIVYAIVVKANESIESDTRAVRYVTFAPSLGTVIRRATPAQEWFGTKRDGHVEEIRAYSLK